MRSLVVVLATTAGLCGCSSGGDDAAGEQAAAFCAAVDHLASNDPFADLAVASPGEMRDAFDRLSAGAEAIRSAAPEELTTQARAYDEAVDELVDQLAGAGYDPRALDPLAYRRAVADYGAAAESIENAADAVC